MVETNTNKGTKVILTITLKGATMYTNKEAEDNKLYDNNTMHVQANIKKGKKIIVDKSIINYLTRQCKPAFQTINITQESFEHMISKDSCPEWMLSPTFNKGTWKKLNNKQRLEYHLKRTTEALDGVSFSYEVLPD